MDLKPISFLIKSVMPANIDFKPSNDFYKNIGINKHRFAKILKGQIEPNRIELQSISCYFSIPITNFF